MDMIAGCGIDIEELARFARHIPGKEQIPGFCHLIFSEDEIECNRHMLPYLTFPLAFSCKEAMFKALGKSWTNSSISWKEIEIFFQDDKNLEEYTIRLKGHALELFNEMNCREIESSFICNNDYVIFQVILHS
jgi:phosphopantetheine--protein transferase-like protein